LKRQFLYILVLAAVLALLPQNAAASGPALTGQLLGELGIVLADPADFSGGQQLILNLDQFLDSGAVHLRFRGDYALPSGNWALVLDEAYLDYYAADFDLRLGKQRLNWGTALQINPTDVINPVNIADPLDDKLPVFLVNMDYYLNDVWSVSAAYAPFFTPAINESPNPLVELIKPENSFENGEFALKLSALGVRGIDLSFSVYRGREKTPTPIMQQGQPPQAIFRETTIFGADFAGALGDVGLWAEGSVGLPRAGETVLQGVAGADYGFENGLKVMGQFVHKRETEKNNLILVGLTQAKGLYEWQIGAIYNLNSKGLLLNPEFSRSLADGIVFTGGLRYFKDSLNLLPKQDNQIYSQVSISF